jgi:pantoate--beta-alanine ligase
VTQQISDTALPVVRKTSDLRARIAAWRTAGDRIGLVPTMGALHRGHLALVQRALDAGERVVVSIFVNPTQFGPNEDFASYPRNEAEDVEKLRALGTDLVWAPELHEMYPPRFSTYVRVEELTEHLDGPHRPGHFQGVATVVTKLLRQVTPDRAYFGEKDYQQLQVVTRLARDLDLGVEIVGVPTVRDPDGLALSSRNLYLSADERQRAGILPQVLTETAAAAAAGIASFAELLRAARAALGEAGFGPIDYIQICDAETLVPVSSLERPARLFVAARLGRTRLIDNIPVGRAAA